MDSIFDDMFATEYESFLIDDEPKYSLFEFNDLCFASECLIAFAIESNLPPASLNLEHLPNSPKYSFLGPNESL